MGRDNQRYPKTNYAIDLKAHITSSITSPTTNSWTDFSGFNVIDYESSGEAVEMDVDSKSFILKRKGLWEFGGCVHFQNNSGAQISPLVASRIYVNDNDEARCSQRAFEDTQKDDTENTLTYSGTYKASYGDSMRLQYYVTTTDIDFISNAVFDSTVAATIMLGYKGRVK